MATLLMAKLSKDPRTGMWILRKRVPTRYLGVAKQSGGIVKISTGTKDDREAKRRYPDVLRQWEAKEAQWDRLLNLKHVTPGEAQEIAAKWAAWIMADLGRLEGDPADAMVMENDTPEGKLAATMGASLSTGTDQHERAAALLEARTDDAMKLSGVNASPESRDILITAMRPVVSAAYRQASLRDDAPRIARRLNPLQAVRDTLPAVPDAPKPAQPGSSVDAMFEAWKAVAVVKSRTVTETRYILDLLVAFLGHGDASSITRADIQRWRDAAKEDGRTNSTWNNRHSLVRQVFAQAINDGRLPVNPVDMTLRLRKSQAAERLPYTDAEAARILLAARQETAPTKRWAHWIMAFSGMRVGEVLQMTAGDIRREGSVWYMAVHEDDKGKSVKTGQRRSVPVHPALIAEGFIEYAQTLANDDPIFPDKALGAHGGRGERGWNAVGKWVRLTVGITDKQKAPNHSWRHRLEDELRAAEVPEDARDAIVGHARKTTGRVYGVRGEALARLHRELSKVPVPPGVIMGAGPAGDATPPVQRPDGQQAAD